jgi:hypothetical protein
MPTLQRQLTRLWAHASCSTATNSSDPMHCTMSVSFMPCRTQHAFPACSAEVQQQCVRPWAMPHTACISSLQCKVQQQCVCVLGPCLPPDGFQAMIPDCTSTARSRSAAADSCSVPMVGLCTHSSTTRLCQEGAAGTSHSAVLHNRWCTHTTQAYCQRLIRGAKEDDDTQ